MHVVSCLLTVVAPLRVDIDQGPVSRASNSRSTAVEGMNSSKLTKLGFVKKISGGRLCLIARVVARLQSCHPRAPRSDNCSRVTKRWTVNVTIASSWNRLQIVGCGRAVTRCIRMARLCLVVTLLVACRTTQMELYGLLTAIHLSHSSGTPALRGRTPITRQIAWPGDIRH